MDAVAPVSFVSAVVKSAGVATSHHRRFIVGEQSRCASRLRRLSLAFQKEKRLHRVSPVTDSAIVSERSQQCRYRVYKHKNAIGQVIVLAYLDAYKKLVAQLGGYSPVPAAPSR
jgi:hypothetical protein